MIAAFTNTAVVDWVTATLGLPVVLGGIAGLDADVIGGAADFIVAGRDSALWDRLEKPLFNPVEPASAGCALAGGSRNRNGSTVSTT